MIQYSEIETKFKADNIEAGWRETIADSLLNEEERASILNEMSANWREFCAAADPIGAGEELKKVLGNRYIELKSHWFLLNAQIQYQMFLNGMADEKIAYRASLISSLVAFFEQFLSTDEIAVINRFLGDPFRKEMEKFFPKLDEVSLAMVGKESMQDQLEDLYAEKEKLRDTVGTTDPEQIAGMIQSLENQLSDLYREKEDAVAGAAPAAVSAPAPAVAPGAANSQSADEQIASLEEQLSDLYGERETIQNKLGVSRSEDVIQLVNSMEDQLKDLYADNENAIYVEGGKVTVMGSRKIIMRRKK